ncbi:hypothetical protein [Paenibacillus naphthalenovorans]|uniref:hypothetical protein n=1 Tax=Paenibacillus naphthalenovorans TaxID=162209 RepID=UPI0009443104|nr:hypothetical protein [Paenibacillus naphthalenovorans]
MEVNELDPTLKIPFFRIGRWKHPVYGEIEATQQMFDAMIANFRSGVLGRPPYIRIGHDIQASSIDKFGDAPAEAWVFDIQQEGDILYGLAIPTSYTVVDAIQTKRYRFASAEYDPDYSDKESGKKVGPVLSAIALTNEPFLTKLPDAEAVFLADQKAGKTTFLMDYEEVDSKMETKKQEDLLQEQNTLLKKLSDGLSGIFSLFQFGAARGGAASGLSEEERRKLADYDELKKRIDTAEQTTGQVVLAQRQSTIESKMAALVAQGVPPVLCDKAKAILLAAPAGTLVKLSDTEQKPLDDAIFGLLEALPQENRVRLSQFGQKHFNPPGTNAASLYGDVVPELSKNQ